MEPHATLARWDGPNLTLYDATQGVSGARSAVAKLLGINEENVRVICPFVGGGFGCKGSVWSHVVLAAMAAKQTGRPVRLVLERPQMWGIVGNRPFTEQHMQIAARDDGTLTGMRHDSISTTSTFEDWTETSAIVTRMLYAVPNQSTSHKLVKLDIGTPTFTRAPGETSGSFALESAMDEMAYQLAHGPDRVSPEELRRNGAAGEKTVVEQGAARVLPERARSKFGWSRRNPKPRSMRDGHTLIGMGVGDGDVSGEPQRGIGDRAHPARRHRDGRLRHAGSRHRHLHGDDAGRRRCARLPDRERALRARRFVAAEGAGVGRLAVGRERLAGGARRRERGARQADRDGARRLRLAARGRRRATTSRSTTAG